MPEAVTIRISPERQQKLLEAALRGLQRVKATNGEIIALFGEKVFWCMKFSRPLDDKELVYTRGS